MKNTSAKVKRTFRLSEDTYNFIVQESEKMNISQADFIEHLAKHYQKIGYMDTLTDYAIRTHKSVLYTDKGVQRVLEMLNMMCFALDLKTPIPGPNQKSEIYSAADKMVSDTIKKAVIGRTGQLY